MKNKRSTVLMAAGMLLLAGAMFLTSLNMLDEKKAGEKSEQTLSVLVEVIPNYKLTEIQSDVTACDEELSNETTTTVMQEVKIEDQEYIGVLNIPVLNLSLPIMENWNYRYLKSSPCRYYGSYLDDSMIISAHNYKRHFGMLRELQSGDSVIFTDVTGMVYSYQVTGIETLTGNATREMLDGDWDLTLFTCTPGGANRVTVRCKRV